MTFADPLLATGEFGPGDSERLHLLVSDWQLVADLAQGDLVLWFPEDYRTDLHVPARDSSFLSLAHVRPSTTQTVFDRDMIGMRMSPSVVDAAREVWSTQQQAVVEAAEWTSELMAHVSLYPIVRNGRTLAVLTLVSRDQGRGMRGRLDTVFRDSADDLLDMVSRSTWPDFSVHGGTSHGNPRVSDGLLRLDADGRVVFASPNAVSVYRRLGYQGDLAGQALAELTRELLPSSDKADETLPMVLNGRMPWRSEISTRRASITLRAIPLRQKSPRGEQRFGALILCRDVTELRRRERELMTKDATIREIHHRVKNNLQTVSALLRLQARRMNSSEGKEGLEQAMRRVSTIAMVHEVLSQGLAQDVDVDDLVARQFRLAAELASPGQEVRTVLEGRFGQLPSDLATPLALILNEIVANAVEHGLEGRSGTVWLRGERCTNSDGEPELLVCVSDDGVGMGTEAIEESGVSAYRPPAQDEGLGLQIVRTLVASELHGVIRWAPREGGGTVVTIRAEAPPEPLRREELGTGR